MQRSKIIPTMYAKMFQLHFSDIHGEKISFGANWGSVKFIKIWPGFFMQVKLIFHWKVHNIKSKAFKNQTLDRQFSDKFLTHQMDKHAHPIKVHTFGCNQFCDNVLARQG